MARTGSVPPSGFPLVLLFCFALLLAGWWLSHSVSQSPEIVGEPGTSSGPTSSQMLLGNPSNAAEDSASPDNYLMMKPVFALAYDNSAGEPRWVSWRLCAADLGNAPRKREFDSDNSLPLDFNIITMRDYAGAGFDRGHMCDHSDRASSLETSYDTFIMTNIIPQAPNCNRKCWAQLENYCRELARSGDRLYISSGPEGRGGVGNKGYADSIAGGRVGVPAECWKVIVVTPDNGTDDLSNVNAGDRVIAVEMPNDNMRCGDEWASFRSSPAAIEAKTGLHFFTALPSEIRAALDVKLDREWIPAPKPLVRTGD
jgi:endonuclease G, mitochondrial